MRRLLTLLLSLVVVLVLWEAFCRANVWPRVLVPPPQEVARYVIGEIRDGILPSAILVTLRRLVVGYALGLAIGLPLGLVTARWRWASDSLGVMALGMQTLPSVCWVPLALLWFGPTEGAMLFVVVMGSAWAILIATENGVRQVSPGYVRAARTMGSRGFHTVLFVVLPSVLPQVVAGMKQGWAFAWRSLMAAEIYVTLYTGIGLGNLLHYGRELHAMDQVLGVMAVIVVIGVAFDASLFAPVERRLHRIWGTGSG